MKRIVSILRMTALLAAALCAFPALSLATVTYQMNDYCVVPAFLNLNVPTNLLLMFDNSASMYDLKYSSPAAGVCSNNSAVRCDVSADCGTGNTCNTGFCSNNNARCGASADCGSGNTCFFGVCSNNANTKCSTNANCGGTNTCNDAVGTCSNSNTTLCLTNADCGTGNTCNTAFCYDNSYSNARTYYGYFTPTTIYYSGGVPYGPAGTCSVTTATTCTADINCPSGEHCNLKTNTDISPVNANYSTFQSTSSWPGAPTYKAQAGGSGATYFAAVLDSVTSPVNVTLYATGNFLNWLTASKLDLQKMIMTGGKYVTYTCNTSKQPCNPTTAATDCPGTGDTCVAAASNFFQEETRGCVGSRFVKEIPAGDWVTKPTSGTCSNDSTRSCTINSDCTGSNVCNLPSLVFGVRGDISQDIRLPSQGGLARIDLFQGGYNGTGGFDNATCQAAITTWASGGGAGENSTSSNTSVCLNVTSATSNSRSTWNHALQTCWQCAAPCQPTDNAVTNGLASIEGDCANLTKAQMQSLSPTDPRYVCLYDTSASLTPAYSGYNSISMHPSGGYLGVCGSFNADGTVYTHGSFKGFDDDCVAYQLASYCSGLQVGEVVDPSSGPASTGTAGNIPAAIVDAGVTNQLGNPIRTYHGRVAQSSSPTGLLQKYQGKIRMGAMAFNKYGSASECSSTNPKIAYTCTYAANQDGGKILSFIGNSGYCSTTNTTLCYQNSDCPTGESCNLAGDHNVGLINAVDRIKAITWTPFAEAYYNSIAYYVNGASTVSTLDATKYTPDTTSTTPSITSYLSGSDSYVVNYCSKTTTTSCTRTADCPSGEQCVMNPIQYKCQSNNVLLITDGSSTTDINSTMTAKVTGSSGYFRDPTTTSEASTCGSYSGSPYIHDLSYFARHRDIFSPSVKCNACSSTTSTTCATNADCPTGETCNICDKAQTINTYVVYTGTAATAGLTGVCDPQTQMQDTAADGGTSLYTASDFTSMYTAIDQALMAMAAGEASSTAASILSNSAGSGANILQAVFYPKKTFGNDANGDPTSANWIGEMLNLWYYVDPFINNSTLRDDHTYTGNGTHTLDLTQNYILTFSFDTNPADATYNQTVVQEYSGRADGTTGGAVGGAVTPDSIVPIWRAGALLQAKSAASRHIFTPCLGSSCTGNSSQQISFSTANDTTLQSNLQASSPGVADTIINWVRGTDYSGYRSRTVNDTYTGVNDVWKLGDIISSTPRIQSSVELNLFDLHAPAGYNDASYAKFIGNSSYLNRGMAYVGANDGMLHAFKLGKLDVTASGTRKATLTGTNLGSEQWAFIPTNALPYLRYLTCVAGGGDTTYCNNQDYGHLYTIDGETIVTDASIGTTGCSATHYWQCPKDTSAGANWMTVLVGGMGVGGASKDNADGCTSGSAGTCVKSPLVGVGYSSYFALDITNQFFDSDGTLDATGQPPKFLWEFSDASITSDTTISQSTKDSLKGLGFTTTGAAIVRVSARDGGSGLTGTPVKDNNGRWFAVFGSGPTGPIDTTHHYFLGTSNQNLKIYIVDLNATMPWVLGQNYWVKDSGLSNAFVSSMSGAPIDTEKWNKSVTGNYQDNALYFGYVQSNGATTPAWTHGGVLRLITGNDSTGENPDPSTWSLSTVIQLNQPVTTGISKLQDRANHNLWLYFGTGRYYYSQDDMGSRQHLFGVKDLCYTTNDTINPTCSVSTIDGTNLSLANLTGVLVDQSGTNTNTVGSSNKGWFITLDDAAGTSGAERSVTDPVAMTNGGVFFSTFKPTSDPCTMGGNSYLWAVNYSNGLQPPAAALKGQVMFQLSTGEFKQVSLSGANTFTDDGGRRTGSNWTGKPPSDPPPIISTSNLKPVKKILHIQEK
jgi:type IV pilus assembly protein PilY1